MTPTLATDRLRLRPTRVDDAEALHPGYADEAAMRYWSHAPHTDPAQTRAKLARNLAAEGWRMWVATLADDDRAIGTASVHDTRPGEVAEIGYSLLRAHWHRGLGREMVSALLDRLFRAEGLRRVFADTDPDNAASNRLLAALGFTLEGRLRGEWRTHLGVRDSFIWGLLADEWLSSSASTRSAAAHSTASPAPRPPPA